MTNYTPFEPSAGTDEHFHRAILKLFAFVTKYIESLTINKPWVTNTLTPAHNNWVDAYEAYLDEDNRTKLITAEKNEARKLYIPIVAKEIEILRADPTMTEAKLRNLDIWIAPHTNTPIPVTDDIPELKVEVYVIRRVTVHFKPSNSTSKAKPHGVHGARFAWAIMDHEPEHIDDLINRDVDTRTPFTLDFDQAERGKTVYFAAAWEMNNGALGQWSEIVYAIIP
jgi:hypothetical protein